MDTLLAGRARSSGRQCIPVHIFPPRMPEGSFDELKEQSECGGPVNDIRETVRTY